MSKHRMKKRKKLGDYLGKGPKKLSFGNVISGSPETKADPKVGSKLTGLYEEQRKGRAAAEAFEAKQKKKREAEERKRRDAAARKRRMDANPQMEKVEGRKAGPIPTNRPEQKLKTPSTPQKPSTPESSEKSGRRTRAERITDRAKKIVSKIKDRRQKKANKSARRDNIKAAKKAGKQMIREARGKAMMGKMKKMKYEDGDFGKLSVKAGIDNNPKPTAADRIAGAQMQDRRKRGRKMMGGTTGMSKKNMPSPMGGTMVQGQGGLFKRKDSGTGVQRPNQPFKRAASTKKAQRKAKRRMKRQGY